MYGIQGDHSPDNVKFPDGSQHSSTALGTLSQLKCYSYHACTSTKYLYGRKYRYGVYNKQF